MSLAFNHSNFSLSFTDELQKMSINKLQILLIGIAMLVAAQIQYIHYGWINPDSVLYLESAKLINIGDWKGAFKVFNWPLYATCIALVYKVLSLGINVTILQAAIVLNVILFSIASTAFLKIIELAGGKSLHLIVGTLILISSQYLVGDILSMLMRDEGFWAFYLLGLLFFIRFFQHQRLSDALLWQICILLATLFRIEAITYLILLPLVFFTIKTLSWSQRTSLFLRSNLINLAALLAMVVTITLSDSLSVQNFGRFKEVFSLNLYQELTNMLVTRADIMSNAVLGKYLAEFAVPGLLLTFIYAMITKVISASGAINVALAAYGYKSNQQLINCQVSRVLYAAVLISLLNMALIITKVFVLSGRYVLALAWIVMIFATFTLAELIRTYRDNPQRTIKWLIIAILAFLTLSLVKNVLPKKEGYNYQQNAVVWLAKYNSANKAVFYDDSRIKYFAGAQFTGTWSDNDSVIKQVIADRSIYQNDILVITQSLKYPDKFMLMAEKLPEYQEVKRFSDTKKKKFVVIYQKFSP